MRHQPENQSKGEKVKNLDLERGSRCEYPARQAGARSGLRLPVFMTILLASFLLACLTAAGASAAATLGVMFSGSNREAQESIEEWKVLGKSGAGYFRFPLSPGGSGNGTNWTYYDQIFARAAENGIRILPTLNGRFDGQGGVPSTDEKEAWTAWEKEAVRRYGYNGTFWSSNPSIPAMPANAWELWNEPNKADAGISATAYGEFLKWAGPAVQSASESWGGQKTGVLFGALLSWNGGTGYQNYFKEAVARSGMEAFTGFSFHPYTVGITGSSEEVANNEKIAQTKIATTGARNLLDGRTGGSGKSLWITEFGWPNRAEYAVTEGWQANMLEQTVGWMKSKAEAYNIHAIIWYNSRDSDFTSGWQYRCGLRDEAGNFKQAWFAFQKEAGASRWPVARVVMQDNTGHAIDWSKSGGGVNTLLGMKGGTSPSVGQYRGSHEVAIQANTGTLFAWTPSGGGINTNLAMAPGTSPSITPLEGGRIAFQGQDGSLWTYDSNGSSSNPRYPLEVADVRDVNGDGKADLVGRYGSTGDTRAGLSTGSTFAGSSSWGGFPTAYSINFADVNGDGKADIIGRNSPGDVQVGLSTGSTFAGSHYWGPFSTAYSINFADVNGDGKADIIGRNSSGEMQVGLSTGSTFAGSNYWGPFSTAYAIHFADVNGDGKADIIGSNSSEDVQVGLSTGSTFAGSKPWGSWNTSLQLAPGTSPSITVRPVTYYRHPAQYPVAFQAADGNLVYVDGTGTVVDTGLGMRAGTSPAIAALDSGGREVAILFQANTGDMWIYEPGGTVASTGLGMKAKTSPAIASLPNGSWTGAFQANDGTMWQYNPGGTVATTGLGMQAESSPSITALGDLPYHTPYQSAFNVNTGQTWTYEPGGAVTNTMLGSMPATSPSIAPG